MPNINIQVDVDKILNLASDESFMQNLAEAMVQDVGGRQIYIQMLALALNQEFNRNILPKTIIDISTLTDTYDLCDKRKTERIKLLENLNVPEQEKIAAIEEITSAERLKALIAHVFAFDFYEDVFEYFNNLSALIDSKEEEKVGERKPAPKRTMEESEFAKTRKKRWNYQFITVPDQPSVSEDKNSAFEFPFEAPAPATITTQNSDANKPKTCNKDDGKQLDSEPCQKELIPLSSTAVSVQFLDVSSDKKEVLPTFVATETPREPDIIKKDKVSSVIPAQPAESVQVPTLGKDDCEVLCQNISLLREIGEASMPKVINYSTLLILKISIQDQRNRGDLPEDERQDKLLEILSTIKKLLRPENESLLNEMILSLNPDHDSNVQSRFGL